jgi:hypothetical protein
LIVASESWSVRKIIVGIYAKRLGLEGDKTLSPKLVAIALKLQKELERREQEVADENPQSP